jgi:hypothetical protein
VAEDTQAAAGHPQAMMNVVAHVDRRECRVMIRADPLRQLQQFRALNECSQLRRPTRMVCSCSRFSTLMLDRTRRSSRPVRLELPRFRGQFSVLAL